MGSRKLTKPRRIPRHLRDRICLVTHKSHSNVFKMALNLCKLKTGLILIKKLEKYQTVMDYIDYNFLATAALAAGNLEIFEYAVRHTYYISDREKHVTPLLLPPPDVRCKIVMYLLENRGYFFKRIGGDCLIRDYSGTLVDILQMLFRDNYTELSYIVFRNILSILVRAELEKAKGWGCSGSRLTGIISECCAQKNLRVGKMIADACYTAHTFITKEVIRGDFVELVQYIKKQNHLGSFNPSKINSVEMLYALRRSPALECGYTAPAVIAEAFKQHYSPSRLHKILAQWPDHYSAEALQLFMDHGANDIELIIKALHYASTPHRAAFLKECFSRMMCVREIARMLCVIESDAGLVLDELCQRFAELPRKYLKLGLSKRCIYDDAGEILFKYLSPKTILKFHKKFADAGETPQGWALERLPQLISQWEIREQCFRVIYYIPRETFIQRFKKYKLLDNSRWLDHSYLFGSCIYFSAKMRAEVCDWLFEVGYVAKWPRRFIKALMETKIDDLYWDLYVRALQYLTTEDVVDLFVHAAECGYIWFMRLLLRHYDPALFVEEIWGPNYSSRASDLLIEKIKLYT